MIVEKKFGNEEQFGELKLGEPFRWKDIEYAPTKDLCMKIESYEGSDLRFNYVSLEDGRLKYADDCMYCKRVDAIISEKGYK